MKKKQISGSFWKESGKTYKKEGNKTLSAKGGEAVLLDKGAFLAAQAPCPERPLLPSTTWSLPSPSQLETARPPLIGAT